MTQISGLGFLKNFKVEHDKRRSAEAQGKNPHSSMQYNFQRLTSLIFLLNLGVTTLVNLLKYTGHYDSVQSDIYIK